MVIKSSYIDEKKFTVVEKKFKTINGAEKYAIRTSKKIQGYVTLNQNGKIRGYKKGNIIFNNIK